MPCTCSQATKVWGSPLPRCSVPNCHTFYGVQTAALPCIIRQTVDSPITHHTSHITPITGAGVLPSLVSLVPPVAVVATTTPGKRLCRRPAHHLLAHFLPGSLGLPDFELPPLPCLFVNSDFFIPPILTLRWVWHCIAFAFVLFHCRSCIALRCVLRVST
jgi:hypothetical protein